ncbi:MAG TPA: histidine kinase [Ornithinibacter sp.]|nr:histidine kinase [Ornithinibacter sp.]
MAIRPFAPRPRALRWPALPEVVHRLGARQLAYGLAAVASGFAVVITLFEPTSGEGWAAFIALLAVAAPIVPPRQRTTAFGLGAAFAATWTGGAPWLAFTVGAGVLVAVAEDRQDVAWRGWAYGFAGAILSLVISPNGEVLSAFIGVLIGGLGGLLLRSRVQGRELEREAGRLRGQTRWLEQRTAVARELHDVVGHQVTAMVVQAEAGLVGDPRAALEAIGGLGRTALTELDALVIHLRDPQAPLAVTAPPRMSDVDELLATPLRHSGVVVEVDVDPELVLPAATLLTVYRIAQEAMTNIARHARATHAWVDVAQAGRYLRLRVADDGVGPPHGSPQRGSGLVGIDERVTASGGHWSITARPGGGTMVDVFLPTGRPAALP